MDRVIGVGSYVIYFLYLSLRLGAFVGPFDPDMTSAYKTLQRNDSQVQKWLQFRTPGPFHLGLQKPAVNHYHIYPQKISTNHFEILIWSLGYDWN